METDTHITNNKSDITVLALTADSAVCLLLTERLGGEYHILAA